MNAQDVRRATIRQQILNDQATNNKRDPKALKAEAKWLRENGR